MKLNYNFLFIVTQMRSPKNCSINFVNELIQCSFKIVHMDHNVKKKTTLESLL